MSPGALLERASERATVRHAVDGLQSSRPRGAAVALAGPAGVGKTALLDEATRRARRLGITVLGARGSLLERSQPLGVARQLVAQAPRGFDEPVVARRARAALAGQDELEEIAVLHGIEWLCRELSDRGPVLVAVDDLQWVDDPSRRLVAALAGVTEETRISLIVTARSGETDSPPDLDSVLAAMRRVEPRPLSSQAVAEVLEQRLGHAPDAQAVAAAARVTGGNPFLLSELVAVLRSSPGGRGDDGAEIERLAPASVGASVGRRLTAMTPAARALAHALGILDAPTEPATAARVAGIGTAEARAAHAALAAADLVEDGVPWVLRHPLVATALRESLPPDRAARLHAMAARELRLAGCGAGVVASHLVHTPPAGEGWAVVCLREAAAVALATGQLADAVRLLGRAVDETPEDVELAIEHGLRAGLALDPVAEPLLRGLRERAQDPVLRLMAASALALALDARSRHEEMLELAHEVLAETERLADPRAVPARLTLHNLRFCALKRRPREMITYLRAISDELAAHGEDDVHARGMLVDLVLVDAATGAIGATDTIERMAPFLGGLRHSGIGLAACALLAAGAPEDEPLRVLDDYTRESAAVGEPFALSIALLDRAGASLLRGRLAAAAADLDRALNVIADAGPDSYPTLVGTGTAILVDIASGDLTRARARADALPVLADRAPAMHARVARAHLLLAEGQADRALEELLAVGAHLDGAGLRTTMLECGELWRAWRAPAVRALASLGRAAQARALAAEELRLARAFGAPRAIGLALMAGAAACTEPQDRVGLLEEAVGVLGSTIAVLDHSSALADLAAAVLDTGDRPRAREVAQAAQELAETCGAAPLAARALRLRVAAGGKPRRRTERGAASLTAAERRIAGLAATGRTNREIAQELYLSPKTVELHLSATFRKLGVSGRTALEASLGG